MNESYNSVTNGFNETAKQAFQIVFLKMKLQELLSFSLACHEAYLLVKEERKEREMKELLTFLKSKGIRSRENLAPLLLKTGGERFLGVLHQEGKRISPGCWTLAVKLQNREALALLGRLGVKPPEGGLLYTVAAGMGSLEFFLWLEKLLPLSSPLPSATLRAAVIGRCKELVELLLSRGVTLTEELGAVAVEIASEEILELLWGRGCPFPEDSAYLAAKLGHAPGLRFLIAKNLFKNPGFSKDVFGALAERGEIELLRFLKGKGVLPDPPNAFQLSPGNKCYFHGHLECLKFFEEQGASVDYSLKVPVSSEGHLAVLSHALTHHRTPQISIKPLLWEENSLPLLQELLELLSSWNVPQRESLLLEALEAGSLSTFQLLLSKGWKPGEKSLLSAVEKEDLKFLKLLEPFQIKPQKKCWNKIFRKATSNSLKILEKFPGFHLSTKLRRRAIVNDDLELVFYLEEKKILPEKLRYKDWKRAVLGKSFQVLDYFLEKEAVPGLVFKEIEIQRSHELLSWALSLPEEQLCSSPWSEGEISRLRNICFKQ